jgi:hypothetical protein
VGHQVSRSSKNGELEAGYLAARAVRNSVFYTFLCSVVTLWVPSERGRIR